MTPGPDPRQPSPQNLLAVALGGAVGTAARTAVGALVPAAGGVPWATLIVNLTGSLLLGVVVGGARVSPRWERYRLLVGTGIAGAYTTFSTFAVEVHQGVAPAAIGYAVVSIAGGLVLAALGMSVGRRRASAAPS